MHLGLGHEQAVAEHLAGLGWTVHAWGQGLFDDRDGELVRAALVLHRPATHWRWIPDLIAVRGDEIRLVDPKANQSDTEYHAIEIDAWMAHRVMECLGLPIVYVWHDFTCNTPTGLGPRRWFLNPQGVNGSGTPFVLIRKDEQHPLDWGFPA
jgi:hypothetical protein